MQANCALPLRVRVGKIVAIFSILLVSFYTTMLAMLYELGLSDASVGVVWYEADQFKQAYAADKNAPLPRTSALRGFIGEENIPVYILERFPKEHWKTNNIFQDEFMYRYQKTPDKEYHYHLLTTNLPDTDEKLFFYYEIGMDDHIAAKIWRKFKVLAVIGGLLVVLMLFLFRKVINHALTPIGSLSDWISKLDESRLPRDLPADIKDDEIGLLAERLYEALTRIHHHNEREREFLRNASHELRTPISIIRNAMDVIEHKRAKGNNEIDPLLQRIRRASDTMKSVTEAILWLVIEGYSAPARGEVKLKDLLHEVVDKNRSLLNGKRINISYCVDKLGSVSSQDALIHIALDNIVRNAFQHCSDGEITIKAPAANTVTVINSHSSYCFSKQSDNEQTVEKTIETGGFGLGLALVKKIAGRQGWEFSFVLEKEKAVSTLEIKAAKEDELQNEFDESADLLTI